MPHSIWLEFSRRAMACQFEILLHPDLPPQGPEIALQALDLVGELEQTLSIYIPTSDLSRLNARASETPVTVALPTLEMMQIAMQVHSDTAGAFDITAAALSETWGFSSRQGAMPSSDAIQAALTQVGSDAIEIDNFGASICFKKKIAVNPGGIGKGYAIDQAARMLLEKGVEDFVIHGGKSSACAQGRQLLTQAQPGWRIAVRHPEQTQRVLGSLFLRNEALGTSGPANQFFYFRGVRYGHIIDPRTGWPACGPLSVTVLHPSAAWADALATGLYVMGLDNAIAYCQSRPEVRMLAILPGKRKGDLEVVTCNLDSQHWQAEN
jgi:thiamine biosynthesis lipoprotein